MKLFKCAAAMGVCLATAAGSVSASEARQVLPQIELVGGSGGARMPISVLIGKVTAPPPSRTDSTWE